MFLTRSDGALNGQEQIHGIQMNGTRIPIMFKVKESIFK